MKDMAEQIKDTQIVTAPPVVIDPAFFLPPDVIGVIVSETSVPSEREEDEVLEAQVIDEVTEGGENVASPEGAADALVPPSWMTVISQTGRIARDGRSVVDVVVELEDIPGSLNYELRLTKV